MRDKHSDYILFSKMKEVAYKQLAWCDVMTFECPVAGEFDYERVTEALYLKFSRGGDSSRFIDFDPKTSMLKFDVLRSIGD
jgi:hypothetical protein